jgi:hypothetical protein
MFRERVASEREPNTVIVARRVPRGRCYRG